MKETKEQLRARVVQIIRALKKAYPQATCALNHASPFELLIATILSAQCTDERVNIVTANLFRKYRKPEDYGAVPREELERDINSVTFFRNKARSIQEASRLLIEKIQRPGPAIPGRAGRVARRGPQDGQRSARHGFRNSHGSGCRHSRIAPVTAPGIDRK